MTDLNDQLKKLFYVDERQKVVVRAYSYLTPIARAFKSEFNDSRYLRVAVARYKQISETVFYKNVELSPLAAKELETSVSPFGIVREKARKAGGVLERYGILQKSPSDEESSDLKQEPVPTPSSTIKKD
jgi:hypothetical protein